MDKKEQIKDKVLAIIQKNYNFYKGTNEAELHSADEIAELLSHPKEVEPKKEVDLDRVKFILQEHSVLYLQCLGGKQAADLLQNTLDKLLPHLQKPVESDAVNAYDFAHWLLCNYNTSEEGMALCWSNADTHSKHDTLELLHLFKQLKK